jgi:hypothetical protein
VTGCVRLEFERENYWTLLEGRRKEKETAPLENPTTTTTKLLSPAPISESGGLGVEVEEKGTTREEHKHGVEADGSNKTRGYKK